MIVLFFGVRRVKKKVEEYEYDEALEPSFRKSLFKTFNKTLEEGFFPMIIVDAINHKVGQVSPAIATGYRIQSAHE